MEFICPKPLIQMPCLGGASFSSWAHPDLQLEFEAPKVRLEATEVVSFRKVEPGAHTDTGTGTCSGFATTQTRAQKEVLQEQHREQRLWMGTGISASHHPHGSEQMLVMSSLRWCFSSQGENGDDGEAT